MEKVPSSSPHGHCLAMTDTMKVTLSSQNGLHQRHHKRSGYVNGNTETKETKEKLRHRSIVEKVVGLSEKGKKLHLSDADIQNLLKVSHFSGFLLKYSPEQLTRLRKFQIKVNQTFRYKSIPLNRQIWIPVVIMIICFITVYSVIDLEAFRATECLLHQNLVVNEVIRPRMPCDICRNLTEIPIERNISKEDFRLKYAYSGVPVVVKGGSKQALVNVTYQYLKQKFTEKPGLLQEIDDYCNVLIFGANPDFTSLENFFNMSDTRANMSKGDPWYIGWSNCVPISYGVLNDIYRRPEFLPGTDRMSTWVFIGVPGKGAGPHIDVVYLPSWQAQLAGRKTWRLMPPYECESVCTPLTATVEPGDVFAFDATMWFHATKILPGAISIVSGAEYDQFHATKILPGAISIVSGAEYDQFHATKILPGAISIVSGAEYDLSHLDNIKTDRRHVLLAINNV